MQYNNVKIHFYDIHLADRNASDFVLDKPFIAHAPFL